MRNAYLYLLYFVLLCSYDPISLKISLIPFDIVLTQLHVASPHNNKERQNSAISVQRSDSGTVNCLVCWSQTAV